MKQKHSLKIVHFNINGLDANFDNLITYLDTIDHSFDIIALSECHLHKSKNVDNRFKINGYDNYFVYSNIRYGGCALYCKAILCTKQLKSHTKSTNYCDYTYVNIPRSKRNKALNIGVYYRHCLGDKSSKEGFIGELEDTLDHSVIRKHKLILAGDFNLNLCNISKNVETMSYFNCLLANNLECHILKPTRIQYFPNSLQVRSATLIDHISSSLLEYECTSGNLYYSESDHFPNFAIFDNFFTNLHQPQDTPTIRKLNKIDSS